MFNIIPTMNEVWTADLGSGAGTNEASSGLSAPSDEILGEMNPKRVYGV